MAEREHHTTIYLSDRECEALLAGELVSTADGVRIGFPIRMVEQIRKERHAAVIFRRLYCVACKQLHALRSHFESARAGTGKASRN